MLISASETTDKIIHITKNMTRALYCLLELIYSFKKSSYKITGGRETSPKAASSDGLPAGVLQQFAIVPIALHRTHVFQVRV